MMHLNIGKFYYNAGLFWGDKGSFGKAISYLSDAIRLDPNLIEAYIDRGHAYYFQGKLAAASLCNQLQRRCSYVPSPSVDGSP